MAGLARPRAAEQDSAVGADTCIDTISNTAQHCDAVGGLEMNGRLRSTTGSAPASYHTARNDVTIRPKPLPLAMLRAPARDHNTVDHPAGTARATGGPRKVTFSRPCSSGPLGEHYTASKNSRSTSINGCNGIFRARRSRANTRQL